MSETENNMDETKNAAEDPQEEVFRALKELSEVTSLIETGQRELGPSDYDCNQSKEIQEDITYRTNVGYKMEEEMLENTSKDIDTLKAELRKALPYLIQYADDPQSGHIGHTYKFRLVNTIKSVKGFLGEA